MKISKVVLGSMLVVSAQVQAQSQKVVKEDSTEVIQIQYKEPLIIKEMGYIAPKHIEYGPAGETIVRKFRCDYCGMG